MHHNFRTLLASILLTLALAVLLCSCQPGSAGSDAAAPLPELRIGVDVLAPFYSIDENGNPVGIDASIAAEACRRAGYTPVFVDIVWDEKDTALANGTVDCLWNAFSEDGRETKYTWTVPYMESKLRILVDQRAPDRKTEDLAHSTGCALRAGSKVEELFLENPAPAINIYACGTFEMAQTAFIKGYVGSFACHEAVLQQMLDEYPGLYRFLDGSLMTVHLGVAFQKDTPAAGYEALNAALAEMNEDGTTETIVASYLDAEEVQPHA